MKAASSNGTTYNISALDNYVRFGSLSAGTYTYIILAENDSAETELLSVQFTVTDPNAQPETPDTPDGPQDPDNPGDSEIPDEPQYPGSDEISGTLDNFTPGERV